MTEKIDDASYDEGRAAFAAGASLRSIVEQCVAADEANSHEAADKEISGALGFVDALLDMIRGLNERANASPAPAPAKPKASKRKPKR